MCPSAPLHFREFDMISKAMILGAAAALVATGAGYYIATVQSGSHCSGGCPIRSMLGASDATIQVETEAPGSCCGKASKSALLVKAPEPDAPTLAACIGGSAYALHSGTAACCAHE